MWRPSFFTKAWNGSFWGQRTPNDKITETLKKLAVEYVKMHHRQTEIPPEPQGKACLAAALAANDDDPAHDTARTRSRN
jgi:hypothetical protein